MTARNAPKETSLREYLATLDGHPDELVHVSRQVNPANFDVVAVLELLERANRYCAVQFDATLDLRGDRSSFSLLANLFATRERCAQMLGFDRYQAGAGLGPGYAALFAEPLPPDIVGSADAPVQAHLLRGDKATTAILPAVRHFEMDFGPVLTMAQVMRTPDAHVYNVTFAKIFPDVGGKRAGFTIHTRNMSRMLGEWRRRGEQVPIVKYWVTTPTSGSDRWALTPYGHKRVRDDRCLHGRFGAARTLADVGLGTS